MSSNFGLRQLGIGISHGDKPIFIFALLEQIANQRAGRAAGTYDQDIIHAYYSIDGTIINRPQDTYVYRLVFSVRAYFEQLSQRFSASLTALITTNAVFFVKSIRKIKDYLSLRRFSLT